MSDGGKLGSKLPFDGTLPSGGSPLFPVEIVPGHLFTGTGEVKLLREGNLVCYDSELEGTSPVWASMSHGRAHGPYTWAMQGDGSLQVYGQKQKRGTEKLGDNPVLVWDSKEIDDRKSSGLFFSVAGESELPSKVFNPRFTPLHPTEYVTWLQIDETLVSPNKVYTFKNQQDGNMCTYKDGRCTWASGTWHKGEPGKPGGNLYMQKDGNLVLYNTEGDGAPVWSSQTGGKGTGPYKLIMQDDGILAIHDSSSKTTWSTPISNILGPDCTLHHGERLESPGRKYTFIYQEDGNLCIYQNGVKATWASGSWHEGLGDVTLLPEGNVVFYDTEGTGLPVWASMWQGVTKAAGPYTLVLQDDGNMKVIGAGSVPIWESKTDTGTNKSSGLFTNVRGSSEMSSGVAWLRTYDTLVLPNGKYKLVNQGDGAVCIYADKNVIWKSGTSGKGAGNLYMQRDGNLVLYNTKGNGAAMGYSGTSGNPDEGPYKLILLDDGNLVIHDRTGHCTWASNTSASFVDIPNLK